MPTKQNVLPESRAAPRRGIPAGEERLQPQGDGGIGIRSLLVAPAGFFWWFRLVSDTSPPGVPLFPRPISFFKRLTTSFADQMPCCLLSAGGRRGLFSATGGRSRGTGASRGTECPGRCQKWPVAKGSVFEGLPRKEVFQSRDNIVPFAEEHWSTVRGTLMRCKGSSVIPGSFGLLVF